MSEESPKQTVKRGQEATIRIIRCSSHKLWYWHHVGIKLRVRGCINGCEPFTIPDDAENPRPVWHSDYEIIESMPVPVEIIEDRKSG